MRLLIIISALIVYAVQALAQPTTDFDAKMREYGLVDIKSLNDDILVDMKYSSTDNFVGVDMYGDFDKAYLEKSFAERVLRAQQILKQRYPEYTLLIYDAARPISVQRTMRKCVEDTDLECFVADGTRGGRHNYGVAVDLTIATNDGVPLDMGAGFDEFSAAAAVKGTPDTNDISTRTIDLYRTFMRNMADDGVVSHEAASNRILLLEIMCEAGLVPYRMEWWHYEEITSMTETRVKYRLLDF